MTHPRYAGSMSKPHHLQYSERWGGWTVWCQDCQMPERWFAHETDVFRYAIQHGADSLDPDLVDVQIFGGPDDGMLLQVAPECDVLEWSEYDPLDETVQTYRTRIYPRNGVMVANYAYRQPI